LLYFFFFCKYFICLIPNALTTFTNNFVIIVLFRSRWIGQEHHSQTNEDSPRWRIQRRVSLPRVLSSETLPGWIFPSSFMVGVLVFDYSG
jgi:hypothetical protein